MVVHGNPALGVELNPDGIETEAVGIRHAADRDEHAIAIKRGGAGALDDAAVFLDASRRDSAAEAEFDALLLQERMRIAGDLAIRAGKDAVEEFEHSHFRPEPAPD